MDVNTRTHIYGHIYGHSVCRSLSYINTSVSDYLCKYPDDTQMPKNLSTTPFHTMCAGFIRRGTELSILLPLPEAIHVHYCGLSSNNGPNCTRKQDFISFLFYKHITLNISNRAPQTDKEQHSIVNDFPYFNFLFCDDLFRFW